MLNEYFVKIPKTIHASLSDKIFNNYSGTSVIQNSKRNINNLLFLPSVTENDVKNIFNSLTDSTAYDHNFLSPKLIKNFRDELSMPLSVVINKTIQAGHFPDSLKISKISAIYKRSGDKCDPNNYRPISILPVFSKFCERIIYKILLNFLINFEILDYYQHGFLKK